MGQVFIALAGLTGALGVALGAFGAHGLKGRIEPGLLSAFETGVSYQMFHTLALFGVGLAMVLWKQNTGLLVAGSGFALGILMFSGSLYGLALLELKWLGPVTPIGGLAFIVGWIALATGALSGAAPLKG